MLFSTNDLYLQLGHRWQGVSSREPLGHVAGCQWALEAHSGWKPTAFLVLAFAGPENLTSQS